MKNNIVQFALIGGILLGATSCSTMGTSTGTTLGNSNVALSTVQNTLNGGLNNALNIFGDSQNFLSNALIQAAMPKELKDINSKLTDLGLNQIVDQEEAMIGQIASASVSTAKPIVENAINSMTPQDAINIISGGKGAATQFLKDKSYTQLVDAISPVVSSQMDQLGVNNLLGNALGGNNALNSILGSVLGGNQSTSLTQNLNGAVTQQLVDGLFNVVEDAENTTRNNPAGILNSVLGGSSK
ncbi:hypothetical protein UJ101_02342 [Flavobacteriaceae bacterium UJ101]|nr:hypothetical protein UJ101_02342 [Flavobacteriaceae bacterium UJ101]